MTAKVTFVNTTRHDADVTVHVGDFSKRVPRGARVDYSVPDGTALVATIEAHPPHDVRVLGDVKVKVEVPHLPKPEAYREPAA